VNPVDMTMALARGARELGARILQDTRVEEILVAQRPRRRGPHRRGDIAAEHVVIAAGMWSRQLGARWGSTCRCRRPSTTTSSPRRSRGHRDLPLLEDPHTWAYFREEVGGLMIGLFEPDAAPWNVDRIPDASRSARSSPTGTAWRRTWSAPSSGCPAAHERGVRKLFCGPESFTPDLAPLVGEAPGLRNCWVAAG
jgi:glycine/D-amino acid oxidase-like deaminating enzyme